MRVIVSSRNELIPRPGDIAHFRRAADPEQSRVDIPRREILAIGRMGHRGARAEVIW